MTDLVSLLSTPTPFKEWLQTEENEVDMKAGDPCKCPLACFLRAFDSRACVYPTGVSVNEFIRELDLPVWAEEFVMLIDYTYGLKYVTRREALRALEEVCGFSHVISSLQTQEVK